MIPVIGSLFAQELVSRVCASRSPAMARGGTIAAASLYMLVGSIPVALGLIARGVLPELSSGDLVLPALARHYLGELGFVIFSGALVSAILSTVDSALLACGSLLAHNLLPARMREGTPDVALRVARLSVVALAVVAYALAHSSESVHDLVEGASAFGGAGVCVVAGFALFTRRAGGVSAALGSLAAGGGVWLWLGLVKETDGAYVWSLAGSLGVYGVIAVAERVVTRWRRAERA